MSFLGHTLGPQAARVHDVREGSADTGAPGRPCVPKECSFLASSILGQLTMASEASEMVPASPRGLQHGQR